MSGIVMVKAYAHKGLTNMQREDSDAWEEAFVVRRISHPTLGECLVGNFITGIRMIDVHYPIDAVRVVTQEEKEKLMKRKYYSTFAPSFSLKEDEFVVSLEDVK